MGNGEFLFNDGHGHVRRLLALFRRPRNTFMGNRRLVLQDREYGRGSSFRGVQCCGRSVSHGVGLLAVYHVDLYAKDEYGLGGHVLVVFL